MEFQRRSGGSGTWRANAALLCLVIFAHLTWNAAGNAEGDALQKFRQQATDPNQVLQSWDASLVNPCTWMHITCDTTNFVIRIDLGNAGLSGNLVSEIGSLSHLQYLELYGNNISSAIPATIGGLSELISLDLYQNSMVGSIPVELGRLSKLRFLRLNNNKLSGGIPESLTTLANLQALDLSYNQLQGIIPVSGSFARFPPASFAGNPELFYVTQPALPPAPEAETVRRVLKESGLSSPLNICGVWSLVQLAVGFSCALLFSM